jgi:serine/threonine protein kinase
MDLVGHTVGPYQILAKIGHGGMAEVYRGFHPALGRYVAIKLLGQSLGADPNFAQRFQREAQAIAVLDHPNIVQIFDFGIYPAGPEGADVHYLVMEYVQGKDLRAVMEQRGSAGEPFTTAEILHLIGQVANALDYAHQRGVIHRDIKPGNILVTDDGRAILTDFGLAMLRDRASQATLGRSFGTPEYIAPEQAIDSRAASAQSDIYSLGVILYEMVTGCLPFEDESPLSLALKHINEDPASPRHFAPDLPEAVELVILKTLAKEPADRFPTAQAMVEALNHAWTGPTPVPTGETSSPTPLSRGPQPAQSLLQAFKGWPRRRLALLASGLLAFLLIGVIGRFVLLGGRSSPALAVVSATVTYTATAVPTTGTETPAALATSSVTPVPTATATASPTYTLTNAPSPTNTPTPTSTLTPTTKPSDTPSATPSQIPTETSTPAPPPPPATSTQSGVEDLYNRILFKTDRAGAVQVYSMNPDGSDQRPVQNSVVYNELATLEALSPDGKQQVVVRTEGNAELWLITLDGSQSEWRITYTEAHDYDPVWSPVGELIAFVSEQTGNGDIYISTPLGFDVQRVTINEEPADKHPTWSPDGRHLAFWSEARFGLRQVYVYDTSAGETRIVGGGPFNDWDPLWVK